MRDTHREAGHGLTDFYTDLTPVERRTFWACFGGWVLDGVDFMIYPLVIGTIIAQWQVAPSSAGFAVTATLLASAVGGWAAGILSDRIGRVRTLQITILWFSVFCLLCAVAQNFTQLVIFRTLLGVGFGGEWTAGAVLIGETIRARYRGRAVGSVQSGWAVGWGIAVLLQMVFYTLMPPEQAWRWMFAFGAIPALLVAMLRRYVPEPVIAARTQAEDTARAPFWDIFKGPVLRITILTALLGTGAQGGYYAITTWVPLYLKNERHLSVLNTGGYLAVLIAGSFCGYLAGAWLSDRIGRRNLFLLFSLASPLLVVAYLVLPISNHLMLVLGFPLGFCASAYYSGLGPFFTEMFPTRVRGSGQGFAYNFGRGIGALFPALVGMLAGSMTLGRAIAVFAVAAYGLFFVMALIMPETRGRTLD
ncbi:transporter transmembrane protein [Bordetella ansorpii]|uniref:Transporter transmembrane protein n=1 Tax=Bordetella ansorpii TaxID=288768 RepID=A0A157MAI8_9BORD|nr:MFS transporter [Bordetella ansorpii]SAI05963.1 transporter transmembrane protein [Bordetella ansorpii]